MSDRVGRRPMLLGGLEVFVAASLMAAVAPITYPTYSYARPRQYPVLAEGFGDPSHILAEALWQGATGTTVVVSADVSGQNVRPLVEFGNPVGSRAVCGLVSMVLPADLGSASINPWTSTGTNQLMDGVQYTRRITCLLYTSPSPRDRTRYRMPSSA